MASVTFDNRYGGIIAPEFSGQVFEAALGQSVVLSNFTRERNMVGREMFFDVNTELPRVEAVDAIDEPVTQAELDRPRTFEKKGATQKYEPRMLKAGEFAAYKVFRTADINDMLAAGYDVLRADIPKFAAQFGAAIDGAVIWGRRKPREWHDIPSLWTRANNMGAVVSPTNGMFRDLFGQGGVRDKILLSGYQPTGFVGSPHVQSMLYDLRDNDDRPLFVDNIRDGFPYRLAGMPLSFANNGAWDYMRALMLMADFGNLVYSIREEMTWRTTQDASYPDPQNPGQTLSCATRNETMFIIHMRMGWQLRDPITQMSESPVPFAFLAPGTGVTTP